MAGPFGDRVPICMRCGARDIRQQSSREGLWPGGAEGTAWVCDTCHYIGAPFLADTVAADDQDATWEAEVRRIAALPETRPASRGGQRTLGLVLIGVGIVFGIPLLAGIILALGAYGPQIVPLVIVLGGATAAIVTALVVVGTRKLKTAARTEGKSETEAVL